MFPGLPDDNDKRKDILSEFQRSKDILGEFRQNLDNNYSFEEKRNELSRSKNVFIGAVAGVILAGIVGWFVLSPRYVQDSDAEIPVIRRPQAAIKVQPTEPGGMEILNQDKTIYDIIDKKADGDSAGVEKLLPPPEEPQIPVISAPEPDSPVVTAPEKIVETIEVKTVQEIKDDAPAQALISQAQEIIKVENAKTAPTVQAPVQPEPKAPAVDKVPTPEKPQIDLAPAASDGISAGSWTVQLMSSPNQNAVKNSWNSLSKKHSFLSGQPHEIESADLGAKGTYYRLYTGAFADRSGADNLCGQIKASGGSCIVKKK